MVEVPGYGVVIPYLIIGSPVPLAGPGKELLAGWRGFAARPARYFLELNRVQNLDEFEAAVLRMSEMTYNFVAADRDGISYRVGAEVPVRDTSADSRKPWVVMDGEDPESFWSGEILPPELLPHSRATKRGWLVTANNDPYGFTTLGGLDKAPFYYGAFFAPGWRAARIEEEIERRLSNGRVSLTDMEQIQMDTHSNLADDLLPILEQAYQQIPNDPALSAYAQRPDLDILAALLLTSWDRKMVRNSSGALAFQVLAHLIAEEILANDISLLYHKVMTIQPMGASYFLKLAVLALRGEDQAAASMLQDSKELTVLKALDATASYLTERFGTVDPTGYRYSDLRTTNFDGAYGYGSSLPMLPTDGGETTVNVGPSSFYENTSYSDNWTSIWAPMGRMVGSFSEQGEPFARVNFPLGNVADPTTPFFNNGMDDWLEGTYSHLPFQRMDVEARAQIRTFLSVEDYQ